MLHLIFHFFGLDSASGTAYLAWSGVLSDAGEITLLGTALAVYKRFTCHTWWCVRHGAYDFTDEHTGLTYRLCRSCHPRHPGQRLTRKHIARIHEKNRSEGSRT